MKKVILALTIILSALSMKAGIHVTIVGDSTINSPDPIEGQNAFEIDFNGDGIIDNKIIARFFLSNDGPHPPYKCHVVEVDSIGLNMVDCGPFTSGNLIDDNLNYSYNQGIFGGIPGIGGVGRWDSRLDEVNTFAYIGIKFFIGSNEHYGWVKLKTNAYSFTVDSYAFNDIASQPIIAGQTE